MNSTTPAPLAPEQEQQIRHWIAQQQKAMQIIMSGIGVELLPEFGVHYATTLLVELDRTRAIVNRAIRQLENTFEVRTEAELLSEPHGFPSVVEAMIHDAWKSETRQELADQWVRIEDARPPVSGFVSAEPGAPITLYPVLVATKEGRVFETVYTKLGFSNLNSRTDEVTHWWPRPAHPLAGVDFSLK